MKLVEQIRETLRELLSAEPDAYLIGEDIGAPSGGAFGVCRGLSEQFPGQVLATPISELALSGFAAGLALTGSTVVTEFMFSDFMTLGIDPIVNFGAKVASGMFGNPLELKWVIRCPSGGYRGYGPTHSQSLQKLLMGVPGLCIYEASQYTSTMLTFARMLKSGRPCLFFEEKVLYGADVAPVGSIVGEFFVVRGGEGEGFATVSVVDHQQADCAVIVHGGIAPIALAAMRKAAIEDDILCTMIVPSRLFPLEDDLIERALEFSSVVVVDESPPGCSFASEIAHQLLSSGRLPSGSRFVSVSSRDSAIPASIELERFALVSIDDVLGAIRKVCL